MGSFRLEDNNGVAVAGVVAYDPDTRTATFDPTTDLQPNTLYTVIVTTDVKDIAGNNMASQHSHTFTTGASADVVPPFIVAGNPGPGDTNIPTSKIISVTFSEPMDASTITA